MFSRSATTFSLATRPSLFWRFRSSVCLAWVFLLGFSGYLQAAQVEGVRMWRAPDHTRLVFDLSTAAEHTLFSLDNPDRLVIDLRDTELDARIDLDYQGTPIKRIRTAKHGNDLRVVLDLHQRIDPKSFLLEKHGENDDRLVVDLHDKALAVEKTLQQVVATSEGHRDILIAIDAGHGGEDPGALGPKLGGKRIREKDVVLALSKQLQSMINQTKGFEAQLIRTGDYYIPLGKRRDKAREIGADLFVSIHADAFKDSRAHGASVYALSSRGATSETARFLARKENEADLIGGVGNVSLSDKDKVLRGILVDLAMTATLSSSLDVGARVLKSMDDVARLHKKQVEQAGFLVLKSPDVPSILVETGFISNPDEARKLNSSYYRQSMARAIFKGIHEYFELMPPAGTYLAWKKDQGTSGAREHIIIRGDTLSTIAQRYDVSVRSLKQLNKLSSNTIKIGQRLLIPAS